MKKFLSEAFGLLFSPLLLLGDYLTHNRSFMFIYDVALVIFAVFLILAIVMIRTMNEKDTEAVAYTFKNAGQWRWMISIAYLGGALTYMLYNEYLISASFMILYIIVFAIFRGFIKVFTDAQSRSS